MVKKRLSNLYLIFKVCCISLFLVVLAIGLSWWVIETWFFNQVIYQKWSLYGYMPNKDSYNLIGADRLSWANAHRVKDLKTLWQHVAENKPYDEKFSKSVYKVAFIGDSYVYGMGVLEPERISAVLERKMNLIRPTKVYTLAQPADDVVDYYANFLAAERYIKPDLYIVSIVWNDFETWGGKYAYEQNIKQRLQKLCPGNEFQKPFSPESSSWLQIIKDHTYLALSDEYTNKCYIAEFIKDIQTERKVIFFNFNRFLGPSWCEVDDSQEHIYQSFVINEYEKLIKAHDGVIEGINVENWNDWQSVTKIEAHPGKNMHQKGAQVLFKELVRDPVWGFVNSSVKLEE